MTLWTVSLRKSWFKVKSNPLNFIKTDKLNFIVASILFGWLAFALIFPSLILSDFSNYANHSVYLSELVFDCIAVVLAWKIYNISEVKYKMFFLMLLLSYVCCFLTDISFYAVLIFFKGKSHSNLYVTIYMIPFTGYIVFQLCFWYMINSKFIFVNINKFWAFFVFIIVNLTGVVTFIITANWKVDFVSYLGVYQLVTVIFDLIVFDLSMLALICSRNRGVYFIASASIVSIASNFWEKYLFITEKMDVFYYSELFWLLNLILAAIGLFFLKDELELKYWFQSFKGIKSQVTFWVFSLCVLSFFLLCLAAYFFQIINRENFISLPFLIVIYSVIVVLLSNFVGNKFEEPFKKLQSNIEILINSAGCKEGIKEDFFTEEFSFLQKFLINAFDISYEKTIVEKSMNDVALQVAHDVRSPVAAILMLAKEFEELPEGKRLSLRNAANRIQDIINNLIVTFQGRQFGDDQDLILVSVSVISVISEKREQYKESDFLLEYEFDKNTNFSYIKANQVEFKRVISNLLNNAVEALSHAGVVKVKLYSDDNEVKVVISDNGSGMSEEMVKKLLETDLAISGKDSGVGLGLLHAKKFLKRSGARLEIVSVINKGTDIILVFEKVPCPVWLTGGIFYKKNSIIVILDDDLSIHDAWDSMFSAVRNKFQDIKIKHFTNSEKCIQYFRGLSLEEKDKILFLADYELIKQNFNGLDVIKISGLKNSILVTSHYERADVVKNSILLKTKILPKALASEVQLNLFGKEIDYPDKAVVDFVMLDDNEGFSDILSYLCGLKGRRLHAYHDPYVFLNNIEEYNKSVKICFDYSLGCPVSGVEFAQLIFEMGYRNLYLATGYDIEQSELPPFLTLLSGKMDLITLE